MGISGLSAPQEIAAVHCRPSNGGVWDFVRVASRSPAAILDPIVVSSSVAGDPDSGYVGGREGGISP